MIDLIAKKRDGQEWTGREIKTIVRHICNPSVPDFQVSALLMAIYLKGLSKQELAQLTRSMAEEGSMFDLGGLGDQVVDKHSTGGVGDKTTLVLLPLLMSVGVKTLKLSGKGLGHTGGTLDKLQVFNGFRFDLSKEEIMNAMSEIGCVLSGQTEEIVPADRRMYALRDLTATVDSLPLIASSIMSKKIASGAHCILLDVKVGNGAIYEDLDKARLLAQTMVEIGTTLQVKTKAILTNMSEPLGMAVGNSLEVREAIETLQGNGSNTLRELSVELAATLMIMSGKEREIGAARRILKSAMSSGQALDQLKKLISGQGGDTNYIERPETIPVARHQRLVLAPTTGFISEIKAKSIGIASMKTGAGRSAKDADIDLGAGILLAKKCGDYVGMGDPLFTLFATDPKLLDLAEPIATGAFAFSKEAPVSIPIILEEIE
ncbi:UNVERIFIED_CONTAM: hypothetical protein GTU68_002338 [Idotea baltica]|nr:hypothetical protein [Idotea baltica]